MNEINSEKIIKTLFELFADQSDLQIQIKSIKETCSLNEQKRNTSTLYQKNACVKKRRSNETLKI